MRVLLLGRLRDLASWREREIDPAPATIMELRAFLAAENAELGAALGGPCHHDRAGRRGDPNGERTNRAGPQRLSRLLIQDRHAT